MTKTSPPDKQGNYFIVEETPGYSSIALKLATESHARTIGKIFHKERYLQIKRIRSRHLFQKNLSYGFNEHLIKNATKFDNVLLIDDNGERLVPVSVIISSGSYLHFKQDGFERQLFVKLKKLDEYLLKNENKLSLF